MEIEQGTYDSERLPGPFVIYFKENVEVRWLVGPYVIRMGLDEWRGLQEQTTRLISGQALVRYERDRLKYLKDKYEDDDAPDPNEVINALVKLVMAEAPNDSEGGIQAVAKRYVSTLSTDDCVAIGKYFGTTAQAWPNCQCGGNLCPEHGTGELEEFGKSKVTP
jgi:hypothetical protein